MYAYRYTLLFIYLYNLTKTWATGEAGSQKTPVTYELKLLAEHGKVAPKVEPKTKLSHFVFEPEATKTLEKVVYDGKELWTPADGKTLKKVDAFERNNLLQLVVLTLTKDNRDETLYYQRDKDEFKKLDEAGYKRQKNFLEVTKKNFLNEWFPLELQESKLYSRFVTEVADLLDGVERKTYTVVRGKPYVVRDGAQELLKHSTGDALKSLETYDFGEENRLMLMKLGGDKKFFLKTKGKTEWEALADEGAFNTKAVEFKSKYFEKHLEYDLGLPPVLDNFVQVRKEVGGSLNELTLAPVRNYFLKKVKFGEKALWESENKEVRAFRLKVYLLGYDVKLVVMFVSNSLNKLDPAVGGKTLYFYKNEAQVFEGKTLEEFNVLKDKVKARAGRRTFTYTNEWVETSATLDLTRFYESRVTVQKAAPEKGVVKVTLTPASGSSFNQVVFGGQRVWPNDERRAAHPLVKTVDLFFKNDLLQLVHLTGTKDGRSASTTDNYELFLKKEKNLLGKVEEGPFGQYKTNLEQDDYFVDKHLDLDLAVDVFDAAFYTVTEEYFDGVETTTVTPKNVELTVVKSLDRVFWQYDSRYPKRYVAKLELVKVGEARLLTLTVKDANNAPLKYEYHEKPNASAQWGPQKAGRTYRQALEAFKLVKDWAAFDLDVGKPPLATEFKVKVNPLLGNKTELVLTTLFGKKLTKVKLGDTDLWTADGNLRAARVHLYLQNYEVKLFKVEVVKDLDAGHLHTTEVKKFLDGQAWKEEGCDAKLAAFKAEDNRVPFNYNADWVLPPVVFDPTTFSVHHFRVEDTEEGVLKTTVYTPKEGTVAKKALFDGFALWPEGEAENTTSKLTALKVVKKNDLVQLLHLQHVLLEGLNNRTDLYFKKEKGTFKKVESTEFNKLKEDLKAADHYVDNNVKLDLSAEVPATVFTTESSLEDGVEKVVVQLKHGARLYEVKASPALWTSQNGEYVTKLEKYTADNMQFLVLHVTSPNGQVTKKYFQKALPVAEERPESPTGSEVSSESGTLVPTPPPSEPGEPSFKDMGTKDEFFKKLNEVKAAVEHTEVDLNLNSYQDTAHFRVDESTLGTVKVYKLYPLKQYRVTKLVHGGKEHWKKEAEGQRLVEAWVYVHDNKAKFVQASVWNKDHTDEGADKLLHLVLNDANVYEPKDKTQFDTALQQTSAVKPPPLSTAAGGELSPKARVFRKLYVADQVDAALFETQNQNTGGYTVRTFTPKATTFVNAVEAASGLLWKASQTTDLWKSATFSVKGDTGHAVLNLTENSVDTKKYFKFENNLWTGVDLEAYNTLNAKVTAPAETPRDARQGQQPVA